MLLLIEAVYRLGVWKNLTVTHRGFILAASLI